MSNANVSHQQWTVIGLLGVLLLFELLLNPNSTSKASAFLAIFSGLSSGTKSPTGSTNTDGTPGTPLTGNNVGAKSKYGTFVSTTGSKTANAEVPNVPGGTPKPQRAWFWDIIDPFGNLKALQ